MAVSFPVVTLASNVDNDNSDVIVLKKLEKSSIGEDLQDALQCNVSRRMAVISPMLLLLPMIIRQNYTVWALDINIQNWILMSKYFIFDEIFECPYIRPTRCRSYVLDM